MDPAGGQERIPASSTRGLPVRPLRAFFSGLVMGTADAVPGVSGGTMALIMGIYERFIDALGTLLRLPLMLKEPGDRKRLASALVLLVPLFLGALIALFAATKILVGGGDEQGLIQDPATAPFCFAFFFGLVVASAPLPWQRIQEHSFRTVVLAALGAAGAFLFAGLESLQSEPETWMLVPGGALAIAVMLLPGISGSLLLVLLNQYQAVTQALHDRDVPRLLVFVAGVVAGVSIFIPLLRSLMRRAQDPTMAVLTGLMIGSLRALWPWKTNYDHKAGAMINHDIASIAELPVSWILVVAAMLAGAALVFFMSTIERRLFARTESGRLG